MPSNEPKLWSHWGPRQRPGTLYSHGKAGGTAVARAEAARGRERSSQPQTEAKSKLRTSASEDAWTEAELNSAPQLPIRTTQTLKRQRTRQPSTLFCLIAQKEAYLKLEAAYDAPQAAVRLGTASAVHSNHALQALTRLAPWSYRAYKRGGTPRTLGCTLKAIETSR